MNALEHKIDFTVIFSVNRANPNGDPLDGNRPRTDYRGYGEVSDVCIKRKLRNRLMRMEQEIFVQSDDNRMDKYRSLKDRADAHEDLKALVQTGDKQAYAKRACEIWYDVRAFGQVFAFSSGKKKKGAEDAEGADAVSVGVRGPVSVQTAVSVDPVYVTDMQITKSVNLETGADPNQKGSDTMGMKHRVDFGLYVFNGAINVQLAEKTGFSRADAQALKEALRTLFVDDATAARPAGSMEVLKLIWWEHNCANGQYSSAKVHRLVRIEHRPEADMPHHVNDYLIHVDELPGLACEVLDGE